MKQANKKTTILVTAVSIIISAAYIVACILLGKFEGMGGGGALTSYFLTFAIFFLVFWLVKGRNKEPVESDERTRRLTDRAYTWSWLATYFAIIILYAVDFLFPLKLSMRDFGLIVMLFMALSAIISKAVMMRKGDLE